MSTHIVTKNSQAYSLEVTRSCGKDSLMAMFTVDNGSDYHCVALPAKEAIDLCEKVIKSMKEFD